MHRGLRPPAGIFGPDIAKRRRLPIMPLWPGFAINTIFYTIILWLPIGGRSVLRRHLRRRGGRGLRCGYDLRGDFAGGCPECGWNRVEAKA